MYIFGGIALSIFISLTVYYLLNKKLRIEIENIKKQLTIEQTEKVIDTSEPTNDYDNLKNEYDNYVTTNNFDDLDEIPENIKTEINNLDKESESETNLTDKLEQTLEQVTNNLLSEEQNLESVEPDVQVEVEGETVEPDVDVEGETDKQEGFQDKEVDLQNGEDVDVTVEQVEDLEINLEEDDETKIIDIDADKEKNSYLNYSLENLNDLTLKELQDIARKNKIKVKGRKDEVLERVKSLYNLNVNLK